MTRVHRYMSTNHLFNPRTKDRKSLAKVEPGFRWSSFGSFSSLFK